VFWVRRLYQATRYFGVFICVLGAQIVSGYKILWGIHLCFCRSDYIRLQDTLGYSFVFLMRRLYQATRYFVVFICVLGAPIVSGYKTTLGYSFVFWVRRLYQATRYFGVLICVLGSHIVLGYKVVWSIHLCFD
jgi:hypothetical protein